MKNPKRFAVIGGGWYGCHLASKLLDAGYQVQVFEARGSFLTGAGQQNQLRLHQGFHYLRSYQTRLEASLGFLRFIETYPSFSSAVEENFYAIPTALSNIDFETILQISKASALDFDIIEPKLVPWLSNVDGIIKTGERLVRVERAKAFFSKKLASVTSFNTQINAQAMDLLSSQYDLVIDTTYSSQFSNNTRNLYEATLLGEFDLDENAPPVQALTLIDGPFWSIYPTEEIKTRSLSHVTLSPLFQSTDESEVEDYIESCSLGFQNEVLSRMIFSVQKFVPDLEKSLLSIRPRFITKKIKTSDSAASREVQLSIAENVLSIRQGKIDAIFTAEDELFRLLNEMNL